MGENYKNFRKKKHNQKIANKIKFIKKQLRMKILRRKAIFYEI